MAAREGRKVARQVVVASRVEGGREEEGDASHRWARGDQQDPQATAWASSTPKQRQIKEKH